MPLCRVSICWAELTLGQCGGGWRPQPACNSGPGLDSDSPWQASILLVLLPAWVTVWVGDERGTLSGPRFHRNRTLLHLFTERGYDWPLAGMLRSYFRFLIPFPHPISSCAHLPNNHLSPGWGHPECSLKDQACVIFRTLLLQYRFTSLLLHENAPSFYVITLNGVFDVHFFCLNQFILNYASLKESFTF